ncbi:MAG: PspA/IM30 family protein, partial [Elusimicrobiota bacterium]
MFKKSLASIVSAAILVAGPGNLTLTAAAQTMGRAPVSGISVTPTIGTGLNSPTLGAPSFNMPALGALTSPSLMVAPSIAAPAPVTAVQAAASMALAAPSALRAEGLSVIPAAAKATAGSPLATIKSQDPKVGVAEKGSALNNLFDNSMVTGHEGIEVLGQAAASVESGLSRSEATSAKSPVAIERARLQKAAAAGELAIVSLIKRAWNAVLGMLGIGVKKMETPAVMAQRIIDQLNAAKPVYNQKVAEASTLVEKLKLQVEGETKKVAELEQGITALLSDSDASNDIMASGMINQQKTLTASIAASQEQIGLAEKTLVSIKEERARFFSEREETMAKIQAGLTKSAAADIQKQIAELKGGFQIGDLKDNLDKFEDAVNDKVADAKGTVDSVESNPDQILKKAKDSLKSQEIKDELARRKAAIDKAKQDKGTAGGKIGSYPSSVYILGTLGLAISLVMPVTALTVTAVLGALTLVDNLSAAGNLDKSTKFYAFSIGTGIAALITLGISGFGVPFFLAGGAAVLANALGKVHKAISLKKSAAGGLILELGIGAAVIAVLA